jgi:hypothetical protein
MGLGLGIAVIAGIILLAGKPDAARIKSAAALMVLGFAVFFLGSGIEFYKLYLANLKFESVLVLNERIPDQLWQDYLKAKQEEFFRGATPTGINDETTLTSGQTRTFQISLKGRQCLAYYVATPPPSQVSIDIKGDVLSQSLTTREYYKTGRICSVKDSQSDGISAVVTVDGQEGSRSKLNFVTFDLPSQETAPPVPAPRVVGTVCTGEFEDKCTGPHSLFVPCGASVDNAIRARMCSGSFTLKSLSSNSGNRCGYGLIEVRCATAAN